MKVGVVGNPRYRDLATVLEHVALQAPYRSIELYSEERLCQFWPRDVPPFEGTEVDALVAGRYVIERRQALQAAIKDGEGNHRVSQLAVNDVAVHKGGVARVVRVNVFIQGENVGPYSADGIIVATPTGSTAYSLSAGGPIVVPGVEALIVTPIAAHTLAVRPLVVPATYRVVIEPMAGWADDLLVSFDGQTGTTLAPGESVDVRRADHRVCLIRLGGDGFFSRMRQKLHWGDLSEREASP